MTNHRVVSLGVACLLVATAASAAPPEYAGSYSNNSVDTVQQLVLLEDYTFCYAVMAGSLDLLAGGRWQESINPAGGIELRQVKADRTVFPAIINETSAAQGKVTFDFHGYSFADAELAVFAVSDSENPPAVMRPLFPEGKSSWSSSYPLPAVESGKARYFFIGRATQDEGNPQQPPVLAVTAYKLESGGDVSIGFDRVQAMPLLKFHAELRDETLFLQGDSFGNRDALTAELADAVRHDCITPAFSTEQPAMQNLEPGVRQLLPLRNFNLPISAVQGGPWFPETSDD